MFNNGTGNCSKLAAGTLGVQCLSPRLNLISAMRVLTIICAFLALCSGVGAPRCEAAEETISIAAAADLVFCLDELSAAFEKAHPGVKLQVTSGSSGNFFAQIQHGAPFDIFLSADITYPKQLAEAGFADKNSLLTYAVGRLVLWTMKPEIDVQKGLAVLKDPAVRKIAIANPEHAPYGRAAKAALEHENLWDALQPKIVLGENIAQTMQFVQSGNADVGLIALSLVRAPKLAGQGSYFEIPESFHLRLEQAGVLTKRGAEKAVAQAFMQYLGSPEARPILDRYGFLLPAGH